MPDERKVHDKPIPRLGGLTFFPVITITLSLLMGIRYLYGWDVVNLPAVDVLVEFLMLLAGSCVLYIVGVGDDLIGVRGLLARAVIIDVDVIRVRRVFRGINRGLEIIREDDEDVISFAD